MGNALEIVKALVKPTEKLIDSVQGAIGKAYEPRHKRKMADATAYEITTIGQAMRENSDIPIVYDKGAVGMDIVDGEDFVKRTQNRLAYQELTKQYNIESVIDKAYDELEVAEDVSEEPVDKDWISRLFNIVQEVSNEDMQIIWGKILAGEIKEPGSFSLRTLETIRNISQSEALAFQKIVPLIVCSGKEFFITSNDEMLKKYGINYSLLILLDECGLMNSKGTLYFKPNISKAEQACIFNNDRVGVLTGTTDESSEIRFGIHTLTNTGRELYSILNSSPNNDMLYDFLCHIHNTNKEKVNITIHKFMGISEEKKTITFSQEILKCIET